MVFASPLLLLALLPWAGAALWLLWGRPRRTPVPFLELWRGPALQKPTRRGLQAPPVFLACAILAVLLALLAAAGPRLSVRQGGAGEPIAIIVDRGITMSAASGATPRRTLAARTAADSLGQVASSDTPVDLWLVPGEGSRRIRLGSLASLVAAMPPTALDTQGQVEQAIRDRLAEGAGPVIVLSDRRLGIDEPRLIRFSPDRPIENIGIVRLAARQTPTPQIMVRLRNDSSRATVSMKIITAGQTHEAVYDLPPAGQERDYFVEMDALGPIVEAAVDAHDDLPADDRAWLVREGSPAKIEPRTPLLPELRRLIDVYARTRPAAQDAAMVAIVAAPGDLPPDGPAVLLDPMHPAALDGSVTAAAHPVAEHVDWSALAALLHAAGEMPRGWTPLVSVGGHAIVACHDGPARQVWVGFEAPTAWTATADFVVFWANVLDWAGHGQERFASYPLSDQSPQWTRHSPVDITPAPADGLWPGLFGGVDGSYRAFNAAAPPVSALAVTTPDWRARLDATRHTAGTKMDLTPAALVLAISLLAASALTWKRRGLTPVSAARTF